MRARARPAGGVRYLGKVAVACCPTSDPGRDEPAEQQRAAGMQARQRRLPPPTRHFLWLVLAVSMAAALLAALLLGTEMDAWRFQREASRHPASAASQPTAAAEDAQQGSPVEHGAISEAQEAQTSSPSAAKAADAEQLVELMRQHVAQHGPAGSFWPAGCRWRERSERAPRTGGCDPATVPQRGAAFGGFEAVWRCHGYEWWSEAQGAWTSEQPAACRLQTVGVDVWAAAMAQLQQEGNASAQVGGQQISTWALQDALQHEQQGSNKMAAAVAAAATPINAQAPQSPHSSRGMGTQVRCAPAYCVFKNLFYRGGRFFFVQEPGSPTQLAFPWQLGRNRQGTTLSVADAAEFASAVQAGVVPGETVLLDWVFFMHPTALGHWLEALMPLFRRVPGRGGQGCGALALPLC